MISKLISEISALRKVNFKKSSERTSADGSYFLKINLATFYILSNHRELICHSVYQIVSYSYRLLQRPERTSEYLVTEGWALTFRRMPDGRPTTPQLDRAEKSGYATLYTSRAISSIQRQFFDCSCAPVLLPMPVLIFLLF